MTSLAGRLAGALGQAVVSLEPCAGGDINQAFTARLADGSRVFVKYHPKPPVGMFAAEAGGLRFLGEANALRVPEVLYVGDDFLVLALIEAGPRRPDYDERLGYGLAALHQVSPPWFGGERDNFIGRLLQDNRPLPTWAAFYRDRRLRPQYEMARHAGYFSPRTDAAMNRLFDQLPQRLGPCEPPARIHGDLWGGNVIVDGAGEPCLIDPAAHGGHREVDLAMMRLFGGFAPRVFAAYAEAFPLAPGHSERVPLYQLYFLLVHVNLFGGAYVHSATSVIDQLV